MSSDISRTTGQNCTDEQGLVVDSTCWWPDTPPTHRDVDSDAADRSLIVTDDHDGCLERLTADSAVGRLALMIQRFAANNQRDILVTPPSSHLDQAKPSHQLMTSSGDVTSSHDVARFLCRVCSYVGSSKEEYRVHAESHSERRCENCSFSSRTEGCLHCHVRDVRGTQPGDVSQTNTTSSTFNDHHHHHHHQQQQQRLIKCRQCPFSTTVREELWVHSRVHIRRDKILSCPKCPFVTEFKHHLEYHIRNHLGSKPFRCTRCSYSCVTRSMLNSHAKSHTSVYQYRCADCVYATKYCHSLKLHLRKQGHRPAVVLNSDGSQPTHGLGDFVACDGPLRGPRTAPPSVLSHRKLSFDDVTEGVKRAWSAEAQVEVSLATSETGSTVSRLPADSRWYLKQIPVNPENTSPKTLPSYDPYAFIMEDDSDCPTWRQIGVKRRLQPINSEDDTSDGVASKVYSERNLPVRKRLRNAEFIARLTANIEAELCTEDRPLDLTAKLTAALHAPSPTSNTIECVDVVQKNSGGVITSTLSVDPPLEDHGNVTSSPTSSKSSDTSRGARRRKGVAQRRVDIIVNACDEVMEASPPWSPICAMRPATTDENRASSPLTPPRRDRRGFIECRHCRIGFRDRVTHALHMGYHGFDDPFCCNMCGHQTADRVEFFLHIATAAH